MADYITHEGYGAKYKYAHMYMYKVVHSYHARFSFPLFLCSSRDSEEQGTEKRLKIKNIYKAPNDIKSTACSKKNVKADELGKTEINE